MPLGRQRALSWAKYALLSFPYIKVIKITLQPVSWVFGVGGDLLPVKKQQKPNQTNKQEH